MTSRGSVYDVLIVADMALKDWATDRPLYETTIHGVPILDRVIRAFKGTQSVSGIHVIGPEGIEHLLCARLIDKRISTITAFREVFTSSEAPLAYSNGVREAPAGSGIIVTFCNAVFLTPPVIDRFVTASEDSAADMGIPIVPLEEFSASERQGLFHMTVEDREVVPGVMLYCRSPEYVIDSLLLLQRFQSGIVSVNPIFFSSLRLRKKPYPEIKSRYIPLHTTAAGRCIKNYKDLFDAQRELPRYRWRRYKKVMVVMNPHSGEGMRFNWLLGKVLKMKRPLEKDSDYNRNAQRLSDSLDAFGIGHELHYSRSRQDCTAVARRCAAQGYDLVIAAGGDGTINAVANGLAHSSTSLGVVPLGTVNLFAAQIHVPADIHAACQLIAEGTVRAVDMGNVNGSYFIGVAGVGFDAYVIKNTDARLKRMLGGLGYVVRSVVDFFLYPYRLIAFSVDGGPHRHYAYLLIICNGMYYGGGYPVAPGAELDDGRLDIVAFTRKNPKNILFYVWAFIRGKLFTYGNVLHLRGKSIEVYGTHYIHLDGEFSGNIPITIKTVPHGIRVVGVPGQGG